MDLDIDPVQQWTGDFFLIPGNIPGPAGALMEIVLFSPETAGTGVLGRHQDEQGRIGQGRLEPADGDHPVFKRLPEHFQSTTGKFRQFIQKKYIRFLSCDHFWWKKLRCFSLDLWNADNVFRSKLASEQ